MKNWMTQMEDMVMNLTGCERQIANTVVNSILEEDRKANDDNSETVSKSDSMNIF